MKVQIQGHTKPLVLKLYNRRLPATSGRRKSFKMESGSEERESKYQELIHNGEIDISNSVSEHRR